MKREFFEIENIISYHFKNRELLFTALTHPSYGNEHNLSSYERLEFVGDGILDFVIADELYKKYRDKDEGFLTKMRASIVSKDPLADIVKKNKFIDYVLISGVNNRQLSIKELSNIFESLTGAIYYDSGLKESRNFVMKYLGPKLDDTHFIEKDPKSKLQEYCQNKQMGKVEYVMLSDEFKDNVHNFTMQARVGKYVSIGNGKSKNLGEKNAAKKMLELLDK